jgi:hypothetical protein
MRMKKFTLMIIAALMAVTANAQKLERAQFARPMQNRVSMTASPMQSKVNRVARPMQGKTQSMETIKQLKKAHKAHKAASVSSIDDLTGTWMQIYYSDFDEAILSTVMEITKTEGSENSITINGWWLSGVEPIEATVDLSEGTIMINPQLLYDDPSLELVNASSETEDAAIVGTIEEDGSIFFEDIWAVIGKTEEGEDDPYDYGFYTMLVRPNGKMNYVNGEETYSNDVYIEQDLEETVYVYNFGDYGRTIELTMNSDKTFSVPSGQVFYSYVDYEVDEEGEVVDYILYGVKDGYVTSLSASGNETTISFNLPWTGFVDADESELYGDNFGLNSNCVITLTDGSTFVYPAELEDVAATPASPDNLEYMETKYGPAIFVDIPLVDSEGNKLRKDKLFYQIYYMIDGKEYAYTLKVADYEKLDSDMDLIPYNFTDDFDIQILDESRVVFVYPAEGEVWEKVGVKSIYQGGGETHESGIIWYDIATGEIIDTGISQVNAAQQNGGKAFNLAGQQVKQGYKGIVIKDGKKFVIK